MIESLRRLVLEYGAAIAPLLRKGAWAVTDQGLFAGANFLVNILLARWMTPVEYGAFTVAYSTFLFAGVIHTGIFTEPMLVFGSGRFKKVFNSYLRILIWGHGGFSIIGTALLGGAALWLRYAGAPVLASALLGLTLAQPFILFLWLMRRAPYVHHQPRRAALAGTVYLGVLITLVFGVHHYASVSSLLVLLAMGGASFAAGLCIVRCFDLRVFARISMSLLNSATRAHWNYGRWSVANNLLTWVPANAYFLLLPIWGDLGDSGALKALKNLIMPILHINGAFAVLLVPELVKVRSEGRFWNLVAIALALFVGGAGVYWLIIGLFGAELTALLYGGQYAEYTSLLWLLGSVGVLGGITTVLSAALRAIESPQWIFWAYVLSSVVTLTIGVVCLALWALQGVIIAEVLTALATVVGLVLAWNALRKTEDFHKTQKMQSVELDGPDAPVQGADRRREPSE